MISKHNIDGNEGDGFFLPGGDDQDESETIVAVSIVGCSVITLLCRNNDQLCHLTPYVDSR